MTTEYQVEIKTIRAQAAMVIRTTTTHEQIGKTFGELMPTVGQYLRANGLQAAGAPFARYFHISDDRVEMEAGVTVAMTAEGDGHVVPAELPGGLVATTSHAGPYEGLAQAWHVLHDWLQEHKHEESGAPWEVYSNDPAGQPDSSTYRTDLYWPIRETES